MKTVILAGTVLALITTPAFAISRYNAMAYTCSAANALIDREGAVIFRYPSARSKITLYDRYVRDRGQCNQSEYAFQEYMPTKDRKSCPVYTCHSTSELDDDNNRIFLDR